MDIQEFGTHTHTSNSPTTTDNYATFTIFLLTNECTAILSHNMYIYGHSISTYFLVKLNTQHYIPDQGS